MTRPKKSTAIFLTPELLADAQQNDDITVTTSRGSPLVHFSDIAAWGPIGKELAREVTRVPKAPTTQRKYKFDIQAFLWAIDTDCKTLGLPQPASLSVMTGVHFQRVFDLVRYRPGANPATRAADANSIAAIVRKLVPYPIIVPYFPIPDQESPNWTPLPADVVEVLSAAARKSIEEVRRRHEAAEALFSKLYVAVREGPPSLEDLTLYWFHELGAVPIGYSVDLRWYQKLQGLYQTKSVEVFNTLYPFPEDLLGFIMVLVIIFGLNVQPLLDLEINALGVVGDEDVLHCIKYRGSGEFVTAPVSDEQMSEVKAILATVVKVTARARLLVPEADKKRLWLFLKRQSSDGNYILTFNDRSIGGLFYRKLWAWVRSLGVADEHASYLMSKLRKTVGSEEYKKNSGNTPKAEATARTKTRKKLNHKKMLKPYARSILTFDEYVDILEASENSLIQDLQEYGIE